MFDQDNSGTITFDELATVMRILGNNPTTQELNDIMTELDKDGKAITTKPKSEIQLSRNKE